MALVERKSHFVRIYSDDVIERMESVTSPPLRDDSALAWAVVERTDEIIVERGKGPAYQKSIFTFAWPDDDSMAETRAIETVDIALTGGTVRVPIVKSLRTEMAKGPSYQAAKFTFDNTDANERRKVHVKWVTGDGEFLEEPDDSTKIQVEVIENFLTEFGQSVAFQGSVYAVNWGDPLDRQV